MDMNKAVKFMSEFVVYNKYASYIENENRRQTFEEMVDKLEEMYIKRFPHISDEIIDAFKYVRSKKVLPSMRSMQFGGLPIELAENRVYNCSYAPIRSYNDLQELMFNLLCGVGTGYSVRKIHTDQLPEIKRMEMVAPIRFKIQDSIEGWADAIKVLMKSYMVTGKPIAFDYRDIRPEGSLIKKTGSKAPGHKKLKKSIENIEKILINATGRKLKPLEVHDIACHIADSVVAGGVRDAAMIALFDPDDEDMLHSKSVYDVEEYEYLGDSGVISKFKVKLKPQKGVYMFDKIIEINTEYSDYDFVSLTKHKKVGFWLTDPQRARANNSGAFNRNRLKTDSEYYKKYVEFWDNIFNIGTGEPGVVLVNHDDDGTNPCGEIGLLPHQFCNLTTAVVENVNTNEELFDIVKAASFIGTLQASFTNFHYLRSIWKETTEKESLLGVSMTGIASGKVLKLDIRKASEVAAKENERVSKLIGINKAARVTCIKPEGTGTLVAGAIGSGIHPVYSKYFIRNIRVKKNMEVYQYLKNILPKELLQDEVGREQERAVVSVPVCAENHITSEEGAISMLNRISKFFKEWVQPGHISGREQHNISATVYYNTDEIDDVKNWLMDNIDNYNGITVLPKMDMSAYKQAPFVEITKEEYDRLFNMFPDNFSFSDIKEYNNNVDLMNELACSGGSCEII